MGHGEKGTVSPSTPRSDEGDTALASGDLLESGRDDSQGLRGKTERLPLCSSGRLGFRNHLSWEEGGRGRPQEEQQGQQGGRDGNLRDRRGTVFHVQWRTKVFGSDVYLGPRRSGVPKWSGLGAKGDLYPLTREPTE